MKPEISRGTRPMGAGTNGFGGGFPRQFMPWVKKMGWFMEGGKTCYLCSGGVTDEGFKVDIRPELKPDLVADAAHTGLSAEQFDTVIIDPPYSLELAKKLYKTEAHYHSINVFLDEGARLAKKGGLIISLSYECPKIPKGTDLIAVWGVYQIPLTSYMRCFCVFKKKEGVGR